MDTLRITIAALLTSCVALPCAAQNHALDRGAVQIAGSAGFTSEGFDGADSRATQLFANPQVHYFLARNVSAGGDVLIGYSSFNSTTFRTVTFGPSVTLYFRDRGAVVHPYLSARASVGRSAVEDSGVDADVSLRTLGAAGGVLSLLSSSVGITSELFYRSTRQSSEGTAHNSNSIGLALGIAAYLF